MLWQQAVECVSVAVARTLQVEFEKHARFRVDGGQLRRWLAYCRRPHHWHHHPCTTQVTRVTHPDARQSRRHSSTTLDHRLRPTPSPTSRSCTQARVLPATLHLTLPLSQASRWRPPSDADPRCTAARELRGQRQTWRLVHPTARAWQLGRPPRHPTPQRRRQHPRRPRHRVASP